MVEELGSCCGLCVTDMDRARTSQVPELGALCQPANPAARPRACWQRKFPKLSTCNVTLITQREEQKGGCWSRLLSGAICLFASCLPCLTPSFFSQPVWKRPPQQKTSTKGSILSIPVAREAWHVCQNLQGMVEMREVAVATALPLCHLRASRGGKRRQRLSRSHQGLFSPCRPAELVPLEHTYSFDGGHVTKSAWRKQQQTGDVKSWGVIFTPLTDPFRHSRHS